MLTDAMPHYDVAADEEVAPAIVQREIWARACEAFDLGDFDEAAVRFRELGSKARAIYNTAICYLQLQDPESAIITLERAIRCDEFLTVALYLRGYLLQEQGLHDKALESYRDATKSMRGNSSIDYSQLGLGLSLYATEVYYNLAAVNHEALDTGGCLRCLVLAHQHRILPRHDIVDHALASNIEASWQLFEPCKDQIFRPREAADYLALQSLQLSSEESTKDRKLIGTAGGELDTETQFMAPIHKSCLEEELENTRKLRHSRKHSRSFSSFSNVTMCSNAPSKTLNMIKLHLVEADLTVKQSRIIPVESTGISFEELRGRIQKKLGAPRLKFKYQDEDRDLITICDDSDLETAFALQGSSEKPIKLLIWCFEL